MVSIPIVRPTILGDGQSSAFKSALFQCPYTTVSVPSYRLGNPLTPHIKASRGWFSADRHQTVTLFSMYWHFVDVVWIFVFSSLYLTAHVR